MVSNHNYACCSFPFSTLHLCILKQTILEDSFSADKAETQEDHSLQTELRFVTVLLASVVDEIFTYKHKMYTKSMIQQ